MTDTWTMLNVESKLWHVRALNSAQLAVIQKASGTLRVVSRSALPDLATLSVITERQFDNAARKAFHGERD